MIWHHHGLLHTDADVVPLLVSEEPDENGDLRDAGMMLFEDTVTTPGRIIATTLDPTYHPATTSCRLDALPLRAAALAGQPGS